jgi:hypothetical protein
VVDVQLPPARAVLWSMLGSTVRGRAVRLLVDERGLDGQAAVAAVAHALRHEGSPWGVDVDQAVGRVLGETMRDVVSVVAAAVRPMAAAYLGVMRDLSAQLEPVLTEQRRRPQPWERRLDGRRGRR